MLPRSQQIYLADIFIHARLLLKFTHQVTRDQLASNKEKLFAVIRCYEVIGEAAGRLTEETRQLMPELPVGKMKGMRNQLIHDHQDVDLDIILRTAKDEIPKALEILKKFLPEDLFNDTDAPF